MKRHITQDINLFFISLTTPRVIYESMLLPQLLTIDSIKFHSTLSLNKDSSPLKL